MMSFSMKYTWVLLFHNFQTMNWDLSEAYETLKNKFL